MDDSVLKEVGNHTCEPDAANVQKQRIVTAVKRRAVETMETPQIIRTQVLQQVATPVLFNIPSKNALKQVVKRARHEIDRPPPVPLNVEQLIIPDEYKLYRRTNELAENFLLADSLPFDDHGRMHRIIIFGRESFGAWAAEMDHIFIDGTFSIAPNPFSQVYAISTKRGSWVVPVLLILLTGKSQNIYTRMFDLIKQSWPQFSPRNVSMDFEMAAINAVEASFPNPAIHLCFFHLVQNMKKQINLAGLKQRYDHEPLLSLQARMITSLAFIPICDLTPAILALEGYILPELHPVLNWFLNNYTGRPLWNGNRTQPIYAPRMWSVHQRTLDGRDRTNNYAEAGHRVLQLAFRCDHPTIWHFINLLKEHQKIVDADLAKFVIGEQPPPKKEALRKADEKIYGIVTGYNPINANPAQQNDHNYIAQQNLNPEPILRLLTGISKLYQMKQ